MSWVSLLNQVSLNIPIRCPSYSHTCPAGIYCAYLCVMIIANFIGSNVFFIFLDPVCLSTSRMVSLYLTVLLRTQTPPVVVSFLASYRKCIR